ncbi:MAG: SHOCT domain-containing protein [Armatimonadetes bacterium]|nr:SHOCT domain-containing protein [Anaerolineae bacterium]
MSDLYSDDQPPKRQPNTLDPDVQAALNQASAQLSAFGIDLNQLSAGGSGMPVQRRRTGGCGCLVSLLFTLLLVLLPLGIVALATQPALVDDVLTAVSPAFCPEGRTLTTAQRSVNFNVSVNFFCANSRGRYDADDDVTDRVGVAIAGVIGAIILFFVFSIIFSTVSNIRRGGQLVALNTQGRRTGPRSRGGGSSATMTTVDLRNRQPREDSVISTDIPRVRDATTGFGGVGGTGDLTDRLGALKEAYDAGLITREEYDRKRQALLNQF